MKLYHGTNSLFDEFDNRYLCTNDSIDQYGSGFYFYDSPAPTVKYGNLCVIVNTEDLKTIEYDSQIELDEDTVFRMIVESPEFEFRLEDHGDIEYEGFNNVLNQTVKRYKGNFLDQLNAIGNDFYSPENTYILLRKFKKLTGINCITDKKYRIYVMMDNRDIEILKVITLEEMEEEI